MGLYLRHAHSRSPRSEPLFASQAVDPPAEPRARRRRLFREDGPAVTLLVDMASLYRAIGSAEVMAAQCARLAELTGRPNVVVQVVPPVTIPLASASLMITDAAAYTEAADSVSGTSLRSGRFGT
jgi:Domain of unknown function (DUF5753)